MMLKITEEAAANGAAMLGLEGQVTGPWLDELRRCCDLVLQPGCPLVISLAGVSFVDREAIALFKELADLGITIVDCSPFVAEQLREVGPCLQAGIADQRL